MDVESNYSPLLLAFIAILVPIVFARLQDSALAKRASERNAKRASERNAKRLEAIIPKAVASILHTGGFTLSWQCVAPSAGYAVSLPGQEAVFGREFNAWSDSELVESVTWYAEHRAQIVRENPNAHFGGWVDGARLYLDISVVVASRDEAIRLGKLYKQLAVYDIEKGETIYL